VLFTLGATLATATLAGLAPVMMSLRRDLCLHVCRGVRGVTGSAVRGGRRALIVVQVALALALVLAAGLLARSLLRLQSIDTGMAADHLVFVNLAVPRSKYADRVRHAQLLDDVVARLESMPAIHAATPVNVPPFSGEGGWDVPTFAADGQSESRAAANPSLNLESVHPGYFDTLGVALVRGRAFTTADREDTLPVAIVSEDVVARTWPGEDPIGKRIRMGGLDSRGPWYTVVGVAAPTRYRELTRARPTLYLPAAQFQMTAQMLVLRTTSSAGLVASLAREAVRAGDRDVRVVRVASFAQMLEAPLSRPRLSASLLGIFGSAALMLAAVGLYAVMATHVRLRDREMAIRLALGGSTGSVQRLVLGESLRLAACGIAGGLAAAALLTRLLRGLLFGVHPLDPGSMAGATLLVLLVCLAAALIPARQATRADPASRLRAD
jgi:predicted permease